MLHLITEGCRVKIYTHYCKKYSQIFRNGLIFTYSLFHVQLSFLLIDAVVHCTLEIFALSPMCRQPVQFLTYQFKVRSWTGSHCKLLFLTKHPPFCSLPPPVPCAPGSWRCGLPLSGHSLCLFTPTLLLPRAGAFTSHRPHLPQESGAPGPSEQVSCCQPRVKFLSDRLQRFQAG